MQLRCIHPLYAGISDKNTGASRVLGAVRESEVVKFWEPVSQTESSEAEGGRQPAIAMGMAVSTGSEQLFCKKF